jgi:hypothetical protein
MATMDITASQLHSLKEANNNDITDATQHNWIDELNAFNELKEVLDSAQDATPLIRLEADTDILDYIAEMLDQLD